jgi:peptidyl-prolyl cis-trans isomerase A (cyclophilin A)
MTLMVAVGGCEKANDAGGGRSGAASGGDPASFTLEQATAGLEGTGAIMAEIKTELGTMLCELMPDVAPETVASFVGLARGVRPWQDPRTREWVTGRPYFDGLAFHRVMPGFMIQGGDPLSREYEHPMIGMGGPGYTLPDEVTPNVVFDRPGRLAMANTGAGTHSGGSQFFVTEGMPRRLDGGSVIFGQCDGEDVVKAIARVPRDGNDKPHSPVTMQVRIYRR